MLPGDLVSVMSLGSGGQAFGIVANPGFMYHRGGVPYQPPDPLISDCRSVPMLTTFLLRPVRPLGVCVRDRETGRHKDGSDEEDAPQTTSAPTVSGAILGGVDDRWVNAVIEIRVPLDVSVDASTTEKRDAAAGITEQVMEKVWEVTTDAVAVADSHAEDFIDDPA